MAIPFPAQQTASSEQGDQSEQTPPMPETPTSRLALLFREPPVTPVRNLDLSRCRDELRQPLRDLEWRDRELRVNPRDAYQSKAAKIYTHGHELGRGLRCSRCRNGAGPFQKCVVAYDNTGYLARGCCANCVWYHRTDVCTIRNALPCEVLARAKVDLGVWRKACANNCFGSHLTHDERMREFYPDTWKKETRAAAKKAARERDAQNSTSSKRKAEDEPVSADVKSKKKAT